MTNRSKSYWRDLSDVKVKHGPFKESWGYKLNHSRPMSYYDEFKKPFLYIISHRFIHKTIAKALENDFGFSTTGRINRSAWADRGIRYVRSYGVDVRERLRKDSCFRVGAVFIACGNRVHKFTSFIDRKRHLVIYAPPITSGRWHTLGIFKLAADYLNIHPDVFRPD